MRFNTFLELMRDRFPILTDEAVRYNLAVALDDAQKHGRGYFGYDGTVYTITQSWRDGCISGDCNPATCWSEWDITP